MPGVDFRQVREQVRMSDVLTLLGYRPRTRCGDQLRGPCPLHGSRSATSRCFAVHLGKGLYHCFRCGASGNVLDLYAAATRQGVHAAAVELCGRLGQAVPWLDRSKQPNQEPTTMHGL
jgi:DNA primase